MATEISKTALIMDINSPLLSPPLIEFAKEQGRAYLDGSSMFEQQAYLQQEAFKIETVA